MAMTFSELRAQVVLEAEDPVGQLVKWESLLVWANMGQREIARRSLCLAAKATDTTVVGQEHYNLPSDFISLEEVYYDTFRLIEARDLGHNIRNTSTASSVRYSIFANRLRLYPWPNEAKTLTYFYYRFAADLTADTSETELPTDFWQPLIEYMVWRSYSILGGAKSQESRAARRQFEFTLQEAKGQWLQNREPFESIKDVMFSYGGEMVIQDGNIEYPI